MNSQEAIMTIDKTKLAADKGKYQKGDGEGAPFWSPTEGEHIVFLCPPVRGAALPYYAAAVHYTGEAGILCADPERNPILKDEIFKRLLKDAEKGVPETCPLCKSDGEEGSKSSVKFMMAVVPIHKKGPKDADWTPYEAIEVRPYLAPRQVWNGIADIILDVGESVCDINGPVFIKIKREGRGKTSTKYSVMPDSKSLKAPRAFGPKIREMIATALADDGPSDPYKILVRMFKSGEELAAAREGMKIDEDGGGLFDDTPSEKTEEKAGDHAGEGKAEKPAGKPATKPAGKPAAKAATPPAAKAEGKPKPKRPPCFGVDYDEKDVSCESCKISVECKAEGAGSSDAGKAAEAGGGDDDDLDALLR
jgi:hypothetical protein